jgi:hypothetical protein
VSDRRAQRGSGCADELAMSADGQRGLKSATPPIN